MHRTRKTFDEKLSEIEAGVERMGYLAKESMKGAVKSLQEQDVEKAGATKKLEDETDELNLIIEKKCLDLLALQQPVAKDLRFISTMMRVSERFERMADYSGKIRKITIATADRPLLKPLIDIPRMSEHIENMIDVVLDAISKRDSTPLRDLGMTDDQIDALYGQIYNELVSFMVKDPKTVDDATNLLFVARYLERMGDIVCKTAAVLVYMIEGKRIWIK